MDLQIDKPNNLETIQAEKSSTVFAVAKTISTPAGEIRVQPKKTGITIPSGGFKKLDDHAKTNLHILAQAVFASGMQLDAEAVYKAWPIRGKQVVLAGPRPELHDIANYMQSDLFKNEMADRDVTLDEDVITPEQLAAIQYMAGNVGAQSTKLRRLGISTAKWNSWRKQKAFSVYYKKIMEDQLTDSMPEVKAALAQKAIDGDVSAIKFAMEVTGEYNPNYKSAVDAQAFVGIVIDAILEEVDDIELRSRLQNRIALKAQALRGVG